MSIKLSDGIPKLADTFKDGRPFIMTLDSNDNYQMVYPKDSSYESFKGAMDEFRKLDRENNPENFE